MDTRKSSDSAPSLEDATLRDLCYRLENTPCLRCRSAARPWKQLVPWLLCAVLAVYVAVSSFSARPDAACVQKAFWRETEFPPATKQLPATLHPFRFQAKLRYNESHQLYRPQGAPDYVGTPSPEVDAAWEALIGGIDVFVTPEEARQAFPGANLWTDPETGLHSAIVTVMHDLHCLDFIRKSRHPDYYDMAASSGPHIEHCLDSLRHSIMCTADMTLLPTGWSENGNWLMPAFDTVHTCRDYEAVRKWTLDRDSANPITYLENSERYQRTGTFKRSSR